MNPTPRLASIMFDCTDALAVDDLPAAVDRIVALGANRVGAFDEQGFRWITLADPEGNEFDVAAGG